MRVFLLLAAASVASAACLVENLEPGASVDGTLTADCRVSDFDSTSASVSYARVYRLRVAGASVLTFRHTSPEFNAYLYLYSSGGTVLALNDDADGETNSRITISLNPGQYLLVASSRNIATGSFKLAAESEALRSCPIVDLTGDAAFNGSFAASGCRTLDVRVPSTDTRPVDRYRIKPGARAVLQFDMGATEFDTYLELRNEQGSRLFYDHAGVGPGRSRLLASVEPGVYLVYAYPYRVATGSYSATAAVTERRQCAVKDIAAGDTVSSSFTDQSCRYLDLVSPSNDASYVEQYRLKLDANSVVTVAQRSTVVDSYLMVADTDLESIFENNDADDLTADSSILGSLKSGTYLILASEADPAGGAFSLSVLREDPRACPVKDLNPGETVSASFSPSSCRVLDLLMPAEDATFVDPYRITLARRNVLTLDMKAPSLDAYLVVTTPVYRTLFSNDDADEATTDSRIVGSLEPGSYLVLATLYEAAPGEYSLTAATDEPRPCPVKDLAGGETASGTLTAAGCRYLDLITPSDDSTPLDLYRISTDTRGVLGLEFTAKGFSPYLSLTDSSYDTYWDDSADGAVKVDLLVLPGTYYILANSLDKGGDYTLATRLGPARDCPAPAIGPQDAQAGTLSRDGCHFSELAPFTTLGVLTNQHRLSTLQRGALTVKVTSSEFAPSIFLSDETNMRLAAYDLNAAGGPSAQTAVTLPPGNYNILVFTLGDGAGGYQVTTSFDRGGVAQSAPPNTLRRAVKSIRELPPR
jgi:hypothetical protein